MYRAVGSSVLVRGFRLALSVEGLRPHTVDNYVRDVERLAQGHTDLLPSPCRSPYPDGRTGRRTGSGTEARRTPWSAGGDRPPVFWPPPEWCCRTECSGALRLGTQRRRRVRHRRPRWSQLDTASHSTHRCEEGPWRSSGPSAGLHTDDHPRFAEVTLGMTRRMGQRHANISRV